MVMGRVVGYLQMEVGRQYKYKTLILGDREELVSERGKGGRTRLSATSKTAVFSCIKGYGVLLVFRFDRLGK